MQEPENEIQPDLIIRASSLSTMFDCAARFKAEHLEGKRLPSGSAATIGTAIHAGTAVFDLARLAGEKPSAEDAVDAAVDAVRQPKGEVNWDDCRPAEAIDIAARLTNNYCHDIAPNFTYRKVEQKLDNLDVKATNGVVIRFTGHVDRQYVLSQPDTHIDLLAYGTLDFKTGKQVVNAQGEVKVAMSAAQLGTYELLDMLSTRTEQRAPELPAMIVAMPTAGKQQPKAVKVSNPHKLLIGDEQHIGMIDAAAMFYKNDLWIGNPRSTLCNPKYCANFQKCWWRLTAEAE